MVRMKIRPVGILPWQRHKVNSGGTEVLQVSSAAVVATQSTHPSRLIKPHIQISAFDYTYIVPQKRSVKKKKLTLRTGSKHYRMVQNEKHTVRSAPNPSASKKHNKPSALVSCGAFQREKTLFYEKIKNNSFTICISAVLCLVVQSCLTLCDPMDYRLPGSSVPGDSPGKDTGVHYHALLQGIFPTQGSKVSCIAGGFLTL